MAAGEWVVGSRVLVAPENDVATVRYVGAVAGTEGEWVGVEFDAAGRGKHDGMHQGVRYFACSAAAGAQSASFVRPHKLRRGATLLEALVTKYEQASPARACALPPRLSRGTRARQGNVASNAGKSKDAPRPAADAAAGAPEEEEPYVYGARGRRIVVELCMKEELMEGQRHLGKLVRAYLPDAGVSSVGPPGEVAQAAGAITVLDLQARAQQLAGAASSHRLQRAPLQGALLPDWPAVARLNDELPALQVLNLRCGAATAREVCTALTARTLQPSAQRPARRACRGSAFCAPPHAGAERVGGNVAAGASSSLKCKAASSRRRRFSGLQTATRAPCACGAAHVRLRHHQSLRRWCVVSQRARTQRYKDSLQRFRRHGVAAAARAKPGRKRHHNMVGNRQPGALQRACRHPQAQLSLWLLCRHISLCWSSFTSAATSSRAWSRHRMLPRSRCCARCCWLATRSQTGANTAWH